MEEDSGIKISSQYILTFESPMASLNQNYIRDANYNIILTHQRKKCIVTRVLSAIVEGESSNSAIPLTDWVPLEGSKKIAPETIVPREITPGQSPAKDSFIYKSSGRKTSDVWSSVWSCEGRERNLIIFMWYSSFELLGRKVGTERTGNMIKNLINHINL